MPLPHEYLQYPLRRHAMDHERYRWSNLFERKPLALPQGNNIAVWITIASEFFPLNEQGKPYKAPGGMVTPYPDFRHYSSRDYGNRVGIFRLFAELEKHQAKASVAMNAAVAERYPQLVRHTVQRGHELICHGYDMDSLHHPGLDPEAELALIQRSKSILEQASGQQVQGWWSPASSESFATPDLVKQCRFAYTCNWANDDLPYHLQTAHGPLLAMPLSEEISDRQIIFGYHHTEDQFAQQIKDQFDWLYQEADLYGGRVLSLVLYPYISGLPYRIQALRHALDYIFAHKGVWSATGSDIAALYS